MTFELRRSKKKIFVSFRRLVEICCRQTFTSVLDKNQHLMSTKCLPDKKIFSRISFYVFSGDFCEQLFSCSHPES